MQKTTQLVFLTILCSLVFMNSGIAQVPSTAEVGDTINITIQEEQELSGTCKVDRDGNIALPPPVGALSVLGLTAEQIRSKLTERLSEYIVEPTVFVFISKAAGFTVHVLGEVMRPNFIQVAEGASLQEAITQAGGLTEFADIKHIRLLRKEEESENRSESIIDFSLFVRDSDLTANPTLKADDVIIIPRLSREERARQTVNVIGAVSSPGTFNFEKPIELIELLNLAGGAVEGADLENVSILERTENGYSWRRINFEDFLSGADSDGNPQVKPGETLFVPREPKEKPFKVNVVGQVKTPGAYPAGEKSRLFDAVFAAGGFTEEADLKKVVIMHQKPKSPNRTEVNVEEYLKTNDQKYNPSLEEGDTVFIPVSKEAKKIPLMDTPFSESIRVTIIGEVTTPDTYQVSVDTSVLDILKLAGGPTSEADLERVMIIRQQAKKEQERLSFNLEKVLEEGEFQLLPSLKTEDTIFVPRLKEEKGWWQITVNIARDLSTILGVLWIITRLD